MRYTLPRKKSLLILHLPDGAVRLPLDQMDLYLSDRPTLSETLAIRGKSVHIAGRFPNLSGVGYEEDWSALIGQPIPVVTLGGDPQAPAPSAITIAPANVLAITKGLLSIQKVAGPADTWLSGDLTISSPAYNKEITGTFTVEGVSWG